jgi:hypothetical protein
LAAGTFGLFPATAVAGWQHPVMISPPGGLGSYPQVAFDRNGDATAVWQELQSASPADYVVMSSSRSAGSSGWTRPVVLSQPGQAALFPRIAIDPSGGAVVVWESGGISQLSNPPPPSVQASFRASASGAWTRPVQLSGAGVDTAMAKVGIDAHGDAVALWFTTEREVNRIEAGSGSLSAGAWLAPVQLGADRRRLINPQLAVNPGGTAVATWEVVTGGGPVSPRGQTNAVLATVKPAGRAWLRPVRLGTETDLPLQSSASFEFPGPHVAIDAKGDAIVVWRAKGRKAPIAEASSRRTGRRCGRAAPISQTPALTPHVAMDARGDATVVWYGTRGSVVTAVKSLTARAWSVPKRLARGSPARGAGLPASSAGTATTTACPGTATRSTRSATRQPGTGTGRSNAAASATG